MDKYLNTIKATSESGFSIAACLQVIYILLTLSQLCMHSHRPKLILNPQCY